MSKQNWKVRFRTYLDGRIVFDRYDPSSASYEDRFKDEEPRVVKTRVRNWEYGSSGQIVWLDTYYEHDREIPGVTWLEPDYEWDDTLVYLTYSRGRSAAYFEFESERFGKVQMFMSDFDKLIKSVGIQDCKVTGRWGFRKAGANIGVYRVGDSTDTDS